jgi:membrane-bound ClpP family serine protease
MWIIISALVAIGLVLIIVEVIFIPGTTFVGILGFVFAIAGIIVTYRQYGKDVGFYVLTGACALTLATLVYAVRSGAWSKFSLKSSINSKVNEGMTDSLQVGDVGTAVSALRPMGKAEFNSREYEVKTSGNFIDTGTPIRIINILMNQVVVEPIN